MTIILGLSFFLHDNYNETEGVYIIKYYIFNHY